MLLLPVQDAVVAFSPPASSSGHGHEQQQRAGDEEVLLSCDHHVRLYRLTAMNCIQVCVACHDAILQP